jgi:hypothetical protein
MINIQTWPRKALVEGQQLPAMGLRSRFGGGPKRDDHGLTHCRL